MPTKTSRAPRSRKPGTLIGAARLRRRVSELGREIARDYAGRTPVLVGVLNGAFVFLADLARAADIPLSVDFVRVSSYRGTRSTGRPLFDVDPSSALRGRHVIVVEDIVDTGTTAAALMRRLRLEGPASLALCALLHKPSGGAATPGIDYLGFTIPDRFVVGYGMDHDGRHRNLPYIGAL